MVKAIWFADDQAMVADTEKGLQELMGVMQATPKDYSMTINPKKNKGHAHFKKKRAAINYYSRWNKTGTSNAIYLLRQIDKKRMVGAVKKLKEELPQERN